MNNPTNDNDPCDDGRDSAPFDVFEPVSDAEYSAAMACDCRAPNACARCERVMAKLRENSLLGGARAA
jgi:hypothetical protein